MLRLCVLLQILIEKKLLNEMNIVEYSAKLKQKKKNKLMREFREGNIDMIVCSDIMSRGLDIDDVDCVINYDVPPFIKTFVHRIGRTGRAGRKGKSYTLSRKQELRHFYSELSKAEFSEQTKYKVPKKQLMGMVDTYQECLGILETQLELEGGRIYSSREHNELLEGNIKISSDNQFDKETIIQHLQENMLKSNRQ